MAIDEWLLDAAVADPCASGAAALRFYRWPRPTLSLGFHQQRLEPHWIELAANGVIELVRRPSGGRAVLHGGDLTYAMVWPDPPVTRRPDAYRQACRWLQEAFRAMGQPLSFGERNAAGLAPSCFAASTAADLVHEESGAKRIGSAQLWRGGCLLQHGSIQLEPPQHLWRLVFGDEPPALPRLPLEEQALIDHLRQSAVDHLPLVRAGSAAVLISESLTPAEQVAIEARLGRYRLAPSTAGATSPELTIPRAI
jgi:lipoate-protein ligase A